jgi:RimJ/RimL family protein N-acetyltransferase
MDTQSLIFLQLELECIRLNKNGYLAAFQCDHPDEIGRLYLYRDAERYYRFLSQELDATIRQHLKLLREEMLFAEHEKVKRILSEENPSNSIFCGRSYIFPEEALSETYEDTAISFGESSLCAIKIDGQVVASCSSVRENGKAAEAWVHTEEAFRGKAYGQRVVLAWARRITEKGKIAFYSHSIHNISSQRLVEKLPFVWVYDLVSYT